MRDTYSKGGLSATSTSMTGSRGKAVKLPDERVGGREDPEIRAAVLQGDAERLPFRDHPTVPPRAVLVGDGHDHRAPA